MILKILRSGYFYLWPNSKSNATHWFSYQSKYMTTQCHLKLKYAINKNYSWWLCVIKALNHVLDQLDVLLSVQPLPEQINPEEKFQKILSKNLKEYSRQRMRALHMSLRHFSNVEARITQKELNQAFQVWLKFMSHNVCQFVNVSKAHHL